MSQQPPPGPRTQPPGPGEPPPGRRSRMPLVALVVAAAVVIGGGVSALVLLLGGDGGSPSTTSPLATAESFEESWNLTDTRTLKSLMTDDLRPFVDFDEYGMDEIELENPEVVEETDAEALAELEGDGNTYQLYLVRQKNEWLIQEINIDTIS